MQAPQHKAMTSQKRHCLKMDQIQTVILEKRGMLFPSNQHSLKEERLENVTTARNLAVSPWWNIYGRLKLTSFDGLHACFSSILKNSSSWSIGLYCLTDMSAKMIRNEQQNHWACIIFQIKGKKPVFQIKGKKGQILVHLSLTHPASVFTYGLISARNSLDIFTWTSHRWRLDFGSI